MPVVELHNSALRVRNGAINVRADTAQGGNLIEPGTQGSLLVDSGFNAAQPVTSGGTVFSPGLWLTNGGWAFANSKALTSGGGSFLFQDVILTPGTTYRLLINIVTVGSLRVIIERFGGTFYNAPGTDYTTPGLKTITFTATQANNRINLMASGASQEEYVSLVTP